MNKRYPCEETTLDIPHGRLVIRLWVTNHFAERQLDEMMGEIDRAILALTGDDVVLAAESIARAGIVGLAAVQVTRPLVAHSGERLGHMIYTEPFDT